MYYVSQFAQGAHGAWLNHAMFTEESLPPTLLHYPNIMLGKIGFLFHLAPMDSYNISIMVLSCLFLLCAYTCLIKLFPTPRYALPAFLFFLFSTSFMNRLPEGSPYPFFPFQLWNTPHFVFMRIGSLPHYLVMNIFFLVLLVLLFTQNKKHIYIIPASCMLTILQPIAATLLVVTYGLATLFWKNSRDWKKIGILTIGYLMGGLYLTSLYFTNDYVHSMAGEAQWQVRTNLLFLLLSIGPIVPYAVFGMIFRYKKASAIERFGMILLPGVYIAFLLPISEHIGMSNARLLFPAQYLFWGWFGAVGLFELAERLKHVVRYKKNTIIGLLFFVFFISVAPTIVWEFQQSLPPEHHYTDPHFFLPTSTYTAFLYLSEQPSVSLILANPTTRMDILIPAISGQRTITGLRYTTPHLEEKRNNAMLFFAMKMEKDKAKHYIESHHMTHILFTNRDGDKEAFERSYPFLSPVFSTVTAVVYQMNK